jgi:radical SAM superfamily enzyme YgiQ (UPF0313 family)
MKVLLINPNRFRPHVSPVGLEYVANSLLRENIDFDFVDLNFEDENVIFCKLREKNIDIVGITMRNVDSGVLADLSLFQPDIKTLVGRIKNTVDCKVVLGGVGFSILPREILESSGADFGVVGYGEEALPKLVLALREGGDLAGIDNLIYRDKGKLRSNPLSTGDYENIPTRRRNIVRNRSYYGVYGLGNIEPMRGCPNRCHYCCEPNVVGHKIVAHKIAVIIQEMKELESMGIEHLYFCDSEFNLCSRDYLFDFCRQLIAGKFAMTWTANMYPAPKTVSEKLLRLMYAAGCREALVCVDSGSDDILQGMGKQYTAEDAVFFAELLRKNGIRATPSYLVGWPGESLTTLKETFVHIDRCRFEQVVFEAGVRIYPNTKLARIAIDEGIINEDANLLYPVFYNPEQVLEEFLPYIRSRAKNKEHMLLYPTKAMGFMNLLTRNFFLNNNFSVEGIGHYIGHMRTLPPKENLKILVKTILDKISPARQRFIPLAPGDREIA